MVLYYQNRVLRLEIAIDETLNAMLSSNDRQEDERVAKQSIRNPETEEAVMHVFAALNGGEINLKTIVSRVEHTGANYNCVAGIVNRLEKHGQIKRVTKGIYCNV